MNDPGHGAERCRPHCGQRDQKCYQARHIQPEKHPTRKRNRYDGIEEHGNRQEPGSPKVLARAPRLRDNQSGTHTDHKLQQYFVTCRRPPHQRSEQRRDGDPLHHLRKQWKPRFFVWTRSSSPDRRECRPAPPRRTGRLVALRRPSKTCDRR
jgi:hypothetical protein